LPGDALASIRADLEKSFSFLLRQFHVAGTKDIVKKYIRPPEVHHPLPSGGVEAGKKEPTEGLAD
ncbi:MAG: hypothetical protein AB1715_12035, partial [Acidobacteriota bacterium]